MSASKKSSKPSNYYARATSLEGYPEYGVLDSIGASINRWLLCVIRVGFGMPVDVWFAGIFRHG
jgi:hypothetical protein